jgi:hypothetical protein
LPRDVHHRYEDPLDLVWLTCAREVGIRIVRSPEVYAAYDGAGTLTLSEAAHFDADDSLAQLIFHELCHALVAGPRGLSQPDWGMENVDSRDLSSEHACHRLQAKLADRYGLRAFFAVTTDHRSYWDSLPLDPLGPGEDPAIPIARDAFERATEGPWAKALERALTRTQHIARLVRELGPEPGSLWGETRALHRTGFVLSTRDDARCGDCAWAAAGKQSLRCRQARMGASRRSQVVQASDVACVRFEARFDAHTCARCGACCREAFHRVDVRVRDLIRKRHPELVSEDGFGLHLARPKGRCVALEGDGERADFRCRVYEARPSACADFEIAGDACLEARRRVGLSA